MDVTSAFDDLDQAAQAAGITISRYSNTMTTDRAPAVQSSSPQIPVKSASASPKADQQQPKNQSTGIPQWKKRMYEDQEEEELHRSLPVEERNRKAAELKAVVDTRLVPELERVMLLKDKLQSEVDEFKELKRTASLLIAGGEKTISSRVDLGDGVFADARVPDGTHLMVEVGLGFFVEHTLSETVAWCDVKTNHVQSRLTLANESAASLAARIKVLHEGISQLMGADPTGHQQAIGDGQ